MMICFRIIQGIGAAILTPLGIELFGKNAMSKLAIIIGMIISMAAASGPVIGGVLNETYGFKSIFYVNVPFILLSIIFGFMYVIESYDRSIPVMSPIFGVVAKLTSAKVVSLIAVICASAGDLILVFMNSDNHLNVIYASLENVIRC